MPHDAAGSADLAKAKRKAQRRAALMRLMVQWHWISAAVCLVGLLLFAATGITLNHAASIPAKPVTVERHGRLDPRDLAVLKSAQAAKGPLPEPVRKWLSAELKVKTPRSAAIDWSDDEAYIALPRPGGDAWVTIDTATGEVVNETTDRGWIAYLNDLHKGRNTGATWSAFIDVFAIGAVVFSLTGLVLLMLNAKFRRATWPLVGLGLLIPLVLALLFIH